MDASFEKSVAVVAVVEIGRRIPINKQFCGQMALMLLCQ